MSSVRCTYRYVNNTQSLNTKIGYNTDDIILFDRKHEYELGDYINMILIDGEPYTDIYNTLNEYIPEYDTDKDYEVIIRFKSNITTIPDNFFRYIFNLISIEFTNNSNITSIGDYAFQFAINLTYVNFGTQINTFGIRSFVFTNIEHLDFTELKNITFGDASFCNCRDLRAVVFPYNEIIEFGVWTFAECFKCDYINKDAVPIKQHNYTVFMNLGSHENTDNVDYGKENEEFTNNGIYIIDENHELLTCSFDRHFTLMKQDNNHFNFGGGTYNYDANTKTITLSDISDAFGPGIEDELQVYDHEKYEHIIFQ